MSNNEKFNTLLNSCAHPRQIYNLGWMPQLYTSEVRS